MCIRDSGWGATVDGGLGLWVDWVRVYGQIVAVAGYAVDARPA
jgi:hypothetical protein